MVSRGPSRTGVDRAEKISVAAVQPRTSDHAASSLTGGTSSVATAVAHSTKSN